MDAKEYITTSKRCQEMIGDRVCSGCGGKIEPIETVDNADRPTFWAGCNSCQVFDNGVSKETFSIAEHLVTKRHYIHYSHMEYVAPDNSLEYKYWLSSQIRGTSSLVASILRIQQELKSEQQCSKSQTA